MSDYVDPKALGLEDEPIKLAKQPDAMRRFVAGLLDPFAGAVQLVSRAVGQSEFGDKFAADWLNKVPALPEGEFDAARMAGNVTGSLAIPGPKGTGVLTKAIAAKAALSGGASAALAPTTELDNYWTDKLKQTASGAALGVALPLGGAAYRKAMPVSPEARALMGMGIQPSVGQSIPALNGLEQKASSMFPGSVGAARGRPLAEWQAKIIDRTVPGAKTVDEANDLAGDMYKAVVPHLKPNQQTVALVNNAGANAIVNPELTPQNAKLLSDIVDRRFANYGQLDGEGIKTLDSDLGALIRKYKSSLDVSHHAIADGLHDVQAALRQGMEHGLPPELQGKMATANKAWRELIPLNKAASARADQQITPRALQKALARQAGTDVTRMRSDPLVDSAVDVFGNIVPDSGTAGRLLIPGAIGAGATGYLPALVTAGVAARTGATRPVQKLLTGNVSLPSSTVPLLASALRDKKPKQEQQPQYVDPKALGLE